MDAGQVVLVDFGVDEDPGKKKYAICVDPDQGFFFLISSERRRYISANVQVTPDELPFLMHDSYINAGEVYEYNMRALEALIAKKPDADLGKLPDDVRQRIRQAVETLGHTLTPQQKQAILKHL